jgi:hypothetical protein
MGWTYKTQVSFDEQEFALTLCSLDECKGFQRTTKIYLMNCGANISTSFKQRARTLFNAGCE